MQIGSNMERLLCSGTTDSSWSTRSVFAISATFSMRSVLSSHGKLLRPIVSTVNPTNAERDDHKLIENFASLRGTGHATKTCRYRYQQASRTRRTANMLPPTAIRIRLIHWASLSPAARIGLTRQNSTVKRARPAKTR